MLLFIIGKMSLTTAQDLIEIEIYNKNIREKSFLDIRFIYKEPIAAEEGSWEIPTVKLWKPDSACLQGSIASQSLIKGDFSLRFVDQSLLPFVCTLNIKPKTQRIRLLLSSYGIRVMAIYSPPPVFCLGQWINDGGMNGEGNTILGL